MLRWLCVYNNNNNNNCIDWVCRPPTYEQLKMAQLAQHNVFVREWILQERTFQQIKYGS